jgi:RNA ligase
MLPNYQDCLNLCNSKDSPFYETKMVIDGYSISLFNYRLATNNDFKKDFAKELRGICFVFNTDGTLFKRYLLLQKFFNLNQTEETLFDNIKNLKIKSVNNKEDGSLATFIKLPNGRVIGKSKMGFDNEQANAISKIYANNVSIKSFVDYCLDKDIIPVFEYVSPFNRIVLRYKSDDLILLKLRDNVTGNYLDVEPILEIFSDIKFTNPENLYGSLSELVDMVVNEIDKEGVVVHCLDNSGNDFLFKVKTKWYVELHALYTEDVNRENILIGYILDEKVDDILAQFPEEDVEVRNRINLISSVVKLEISSIVEKIDALYKIYLDLGSDRKTFALTYLDKDPLAKFCFNKIRGEDSFEIAKMILREKTKKLSTSREWIASKIENFEFKEIIED